MNNARMVGVAPGAHLASWAIFRTNILRATDEQMMDAYQYQSNVVSVQNHSWGFAGLALNAPGLIEQIGISNAVTAGRFGLGAIMVRSAGNDRELGANADDDGYPSDPRAIAVAAVRIDGRVASYSEPGACVLVAAPSGDFGLDGLFTTDLLGPRGFNQLSFFPPFQDLSGYVFSQLGFTGTSASAPLIAGVAALILSANPNLSYRDVQQILILSSRHFDLADPDLVLNAAGLLVSHNDGFGVPDAGVAVSLARSWVNRPPIARLSFTSSNPQTIPDDGLRVVVTGQNVPKNLKYIRTLPSTGPHADEPTEALPLVDVGLATNAITVNLTNKGALIERGITLLPTKIDIAARAGAAFAVVYNFATNSDPNSAPGGDQLIPIGGADFVPIPAVFIGHTDGVALRELVQSDKNARARIRLQTVDYAFNVRDSLLCEHVGVRVKTDHPLRGDVRITLVSPGGTRSVLQRYNADESPGPVDWTYYTTHHFYESSVGTWTVYFSDEGAGNSGTVHEVTLLISGVPIRDHDHDGLDDDWERAHFHGYSQGPRDDPDRDGYSNMREQIMGTDPNVIDVPFRLDLSRWNQTRARLSWPSSSNFVYQISGGTNASSLRVMTNVAGRFPETEWFAPFNASPRQFFRVRAIPLP
jgi:subtilisin-like proprotein convertase family protein